jgi:hypothetical protein
MVHRISAAIYHVPATWEQEKMNTIHESTPNDFCFSWIGVICGSLLIGSEVPIVPGDFPSEQNVFHAGAGPDVVDYQIAL